MRVVSPAFLLATVALACGTPPSTSQPTPVGERYVAPSDRTLVGDIDPSFDGQNIYLTNASSVTVVITSVRLYDCQNVDVFKGDADVENDQKLGEYCLND